MPLKEQKAKEQEEKEFEQELEREKQAEEKAQGKPAEVQIGNPDAKKLEAGKRKVEELDKKEDVLLKELDSVRKERQRVHTSIQFETKQASLAQCLAQMKMNPPVVANPFQNREPIPMLPGALTAEELAAAEKLKVKK
jgi:hypothetical protein